MPSFPRSTHHHHHLTKDGAIPEVKYNHDELFENAIIGIMALDLFSAVKGSLFHGDAINIDNLVRFLGETDTTKTLNLKKVMSVYLCPKKVFRKE